MAGPRKCSLSAVLVQKHITLCDCAGRLSSLRCLGSFLPITLEQLARERGVLLGDKSKPCSASFHITQSATPGSDSVLFSTRTVSTLSTDAGPCVIRLLGIEINTASFALYTFSLSVLVQAILIISMSGAADHGKYRKSLLLSFAFTGAIATMLFLAIVPRVYVLGALLAVISNSCFGASFVLLNSFLPLLVRHHPSVQSTASDSRHQSEEGTHNEEPFYHEDDGLDNSTQALLGSSQAARKPQYPLVIATGHQGASSMGSHMLRSATGQTRQSICISGIAAFHQNIILWHWNWIYSWSGGSNSCNWDHHSHQLYLRLFQPRVSHSAILHWLVVDFVYHTCSAVAPTSARSFDPFDGGG